ncbi:hypothetical protein J6590_083490 [Homalodisca vitripennis]|nr:hypothetical protein J6590_083490 [Homalodisca vitripennis]
MAKVIWHAKNNKSTGIAHSISADFHHPRHMTAGVAVVIKKIFGKPTPWHRRSKHLAVQECNEGVTVFSLITKQNYFGKPILHNYDAAFSDLTTEFKKKNLKHLICSPIGCVRDKVNTDHFIRNVRKFQQVTKATVTIVSYYQKSFRTLRNGMSHPDFVKELEDLIYQNSKEEDSSSAIDLQQSPVSPRVTPGHQTYSAAVKSGSVKVLKQSSDKVLKSKNINSRSICLLNTTPPPTTVSDNTPQISTTTANTPQISAPTTITPSNTTPPTTTISSHQKIIYHKELEQAKRLAVEEYIGNSTNPCKAAWKVISNEYSPTHSSEKKFHNNVVDPYYVHVSCPSENDVLR